MKLTASQIILSSISIILLPIAIMSSSDFSADSLYTFSQAKDILQLETLLGWNYSAIPYTFPDVMFSIPFAVLFNNPYYFYLATAPLQIYLFLLLYSYYASRYRPNIGFSNSFVTSTIAAITIGIVAVFSAGESYFKVINTFFQLGYHGFAALLAVILFLFARIDNFEKLINNFIFYFIILIVLIASDFYFAFYFGVLLLASINKSNWKKIIAIGIAFSFLSICIFMLSWHLNPSLKIQVLSSIAPPEFNKKHSFIAILRIITIPTLSYIYLIYKNKSNEEQKQLYLALLLGAFLLWISGQLKDEHSFRYIAFAFPISIILLSQVCLALTAKARFFIASFFSIFAISLALTNLVVLGHIRNPVYEHEIFCLNQQETKHSSIIAEYWAAKPIFEATNRQYNLLQISQDLSKFSWINNRAWGELYKDNGITYLIMAGVDSSALNNITTKLQTELICDGSILKIKSEPSSVVK